MAASSQVVRMQRNLKATREDQRKNVLCRYNGRCKNPDCSFRHDTPSNPQPAPSGIQVPEMCHFHQKGACTFGAKCRNFHDRDKFIEACARLAPPHSKAHPQSPQQDDEIVLDEPEQVMRPIAAPVRAQQQAPSTGPAQPALAPAKASQSASHKRSAVPDKDEGEQAAQKRSDVWRRLGRSSKAVPDSKPPVAERLSREPSSAAMQPAAPKPSSAGSSRRPSAPGGPAMLLNRAMEAADRLSPAPLQSAAAAAQGPGSSPFQAVHVQQQSNGQHQQQQQRGDPAARWQGFQNPSNTGLHMVSNIAATRSRDGPVSEQRLTSRMSQMQMDTGPHLASAVGLPAHVQAAQHSHPAGPQRLLQSGSGGASGRGGGYGQRANPPAPMSLATAPPLGGGTPSHAGTANGLVKRVGKGSGKQPTPLKAALKTNAGNGQTQGPQRKRKSDDEGSSGEPPASSRRKVASSKQAVASASPSAGEAATASGTGDWMAAAEQKLQRAKAARAANTRAADGHSSLLDPRGQAQSQPGPSQHGWATAGAGRANASSSQQPMAIDSPAGATEKPANAQSQLPTKSPDVPFNSLQAQSAVIKNTSIVQELQPLPPAEAAPAGDMDDTLRTLQMLLEQG